MYVLLNKCIFAYKVSFRKPEWKRPLGRPRCRWEVIKTDPKEIWECRLDSTGSGFDPLVDSCEHDNEPFVSIKNRISLPVEWISAFQGLFSME
jgi:hypothetical protein